VDGDADSSILGSFTAGVMLALIAALLVGMLVLVTRFLRGSWNP
jgi:hypothetical protein